MSNTTIIITPAFAPIEYHNDLANFVRRCSCDVVEHLDAAADFYKQNLITAGQWDAIRAKYQAKLAHYNEMWSACKKACSIADHNRSNRSVMSAGGTYTMTDAERALVAEAEQLRADLCSI